MRQMKVVYGLPGALVTLLCDVPPQRWKPRSKAAGGTRETGYGVAASYRKGLRQQFVDLTVPYLDHEADAVFDWLEFAQEHVSLPFDLWLDAADDATRYRAVLVTPALGDEIAPQPSEYRRGWTIDVRVRTTAADAARRVTTPFLPPVGPVVTADSITLSPTSLTLDPSTTTDPTADSIAVLPATLALDTPTGGGTEGTSGGGGGGVTPVPTFSSLPSLSGTPSTWVEDYAAMATARALGTGARFTDARSGVSRLRLSASPDAETAMEYSGGGPYAGIRDATTGLHHVALLVGGTYRVVDYQRGASVLTNPRALPHGQAQTNGIAFSYLDASVLYALAADNVLRRYRVSSGSVVDENTGHFPLNVGALASFPTDEVAGWLMHDTADRWFVFSSTAVGAVWAWDSQTGTVRTRTIAALITAGSVPSTIGTDPAKIDEAYIDHSGRYVWIALADFGSLVWDLTTDHVTRMGAHFAHGQPARGAIQSPNYVEVFQSPPTNLTVTGEGIGYVAFAPVGADGDAAPAPVLTNGATSIYSAAWGEKADHSSAAYAQPGATTLGQVVLVDASAQTVRPTGVDQYPRWSDAAWTLDSGSVYKRVYAAGAFTVPGSVVQCDDATGRLALRTLTVASSRGAMVAGSSYVDTTTRTVYAWRSDSLAVRTFTGSDGFQESTCYAMTATPMNGALVVQTIDRSDRRYLASALRHPAQSLDPDNGYRQFSFASLSADGLIALSNADFGAYGGRQDVVITDVPTA